MAAGILLITEAGGLVGDLEGEANYMESGRIVAGNPKIFVQLLQAIEPHIPASLRTLDNVIVQPHQGSATVETRERMAALMADNLLDWLEGKPARTPVAECAHLNRK